MILWVLGIILLAIYYAGVICTAGLIINDFASFSNPNYYELFYSFVWPILVLIAIYNHYTDS